MEYIIFSLMVGMAFGTAVTIGVYAFIIKKDKTDENSK